MKDKRGEKEAVPCNFEDFLNEFQMGTLAKIEEFGWHIWFIRRPLFQDSLVVAVDSENHITAVLEEDGNLNKNHGLVFRP